MSDRSWALLFVRLLLGLIFFMVGIWKVFDLGPVEHARQFFVNDYADSFLPTWLLWIAGLTTPVVELVAGAMLLVGLRVRAALLALAGVLVMVTFGHLLAAPLYAFNTHVVPRALMIFVLLWAPRGADVATLDRWLERRRVP